jgi:zinc D-Ala-D-Ala dipeptidase
MIVYSNQVIKADFLTCTLESSVVRRYPTANHARRCMAGPGGPVGPAGPVGHTVGCAACHCPGASCNHDHVMPDEAVPLENVVLMGDSRVTEIPVSDVGEDLSDVRDYGLRVSSARADDVGDFAHVRTGVATRLQRAAEALPRGVHLLLIEGYRPPVLQRRYFDEYLGSLRDASPGADEEQLLMLASRYVSPPGIAPHSAGAAIDLTLCDGDGTELDLGTPVNASPEQSAGACYTRHPSVVGEARRNRATLAEALHAAGLVNYPTEWWHWSFGDRYWAMATGAPSAIYGAVNRR